MTPILRIPTAKPVARALAAASAPMSVDELAMATGAIPYSIYLRLLDWKRDGFVAVTRDEPRRYFLTQDSATPLPGIAPRQSDARQRIWTALRVLKRVDVPTLIMTAEATRKTVQVFLLDLQRAGYVRRTSDGNRRLGALSIFTMVRRSGPRAPTITTPRRADGRRGRVLIDNNSGDRHDIGAAAPADGARGVNHVC